MSAFENLILEALLRIANQLERIADIAERESNQE